MRVKGRQRKVRSYVEYWPVGLGLGLGLASLDRRGIGWIWLRPTGKVSPSPWCCNQRFLAFPICRNAAEKLGRAGVVHAGQEMLRLSAPLLNQNSAESLGTATAAMRSATLCWRWFDPHCNCAAPKNVHFP